MDIVVHCWSYFVRVWSCFVCEVSEAIATGLVQNMASRRKRGLTEDEILQLVFDSDAESDICDDEDVSLDDGEDQSDESSSDEEEEENVCAAEDPLDTLPPSPKARKMEEWQWEEDDSVENIVKHSFSGQPGIKRSIELQVGGSPTALGMFNALLGVAIWSIIALHTNGFARERQLLHPDSSWHKTTADEVKAYFTLCVLMSQVKKSSIQSYWSTRSVTSTPFFATVMSRHRFWALSRYLHFCNNSLPQSEDRLWKIRPVLDIILKSVGVAYNPEASVAVDESLMKFRGRLSYVQFNSSKRARFGVKFYKLCESPSGYCLNFSIYTGKVRRRQQQMGYCAVSPLFLTSLENAFLTATQYLWTTGTLRLHFFVTSKMRVRMPLVQFVYTARICQKASSSSS
uniref:Putative piggybac transposable element-derived n=1 Tax=Rhipicephalus microplus TaxID=6941 RepID=A0A6G5ABU7_RHIMP